MDIFYASVHIDPWDEPWFVLMRFEDTRLISEVMNSNGTIWETDQAISYSCITRSIDAGAFDNAE